MRLKHPDMQPAAAPVRIRFDGAEIEALPGETIAAALAAADIVAVRRARSGAPRGPYCGMGVCFDCLVTVDGRPSQRACLTKVAPGMDVRTAPVATARPTEPAAPAEEITCDVPITRSPCERSKTLEFFGGLRSRFLSEIGGVGPIQSTKFSEGNAKLMKPLGIAVCGELFRPSHCLGHYRRRQ